MTNRIPFRSQFEIHAYQMFTQGNLPDELAIHNQFPYVSDMGAALIQNALQDGYAVLVDTKELRKQSKFMYHFPECWLMDIDAASNIVDLSKSMQDDSALFALLNVGDLVATPGDTISWDTPTYHILKDGTESEAVSWYHQRDRPLTELLVRPTYTPAIPILGTPYSRNRLMRMDTETATSPLDSIQAIRCRDFVGIHDGITMDKSVHPNKRRRGRPATFGSMADYPHLVKAFVTTNTYRPVIKDLIRDYPQLAETGEVPTILAGISIRDAFNSDTKQELLHLSFQREIPNVANKCHIGVGILAAGVSPRLSDKAKARLWQNAQNIDEKIRDAMLGYAQEDPFTIRFADSVLNTSPQSLSTKKSWRNAIRNSSLGYALAYPKMANDILESDDIGRQARDELKDLSDMLYKMHKQKMPDTINSVRRLHERHQDAQHTYRKFENQNLENEVLDITNTRYKAIDEALAVVGFERMTNALQMYEEGERMHHCIFTYKDHMLNESSAFYTGVIDSERHTLQVTLTGEGPRVDQMYRKYDAPSTNQAKAAVTTAFEIAQLPKKERAIALEALIERIASAEAKSVPVTHTTTSLLENQATNAEFDIDASVADNVQNQYPHIGEDLMRHQDPAEEEHEGGHAFNNPVPYDPDEEILF